MSADGTGRTSALRALALLCVATSAAILLLALSLPTVFFKPLNGPDEIYSIYGGVVSLWKDGSPISAGIVFAFSIVFPSGKLLFLAWLGLRGVAGPLAQRVLRALVVLGKWSFVDVFIIALFVGSFLPSALARSSSRPGIHLFALAILLSMVAARLVSRVVGVGESRRPPRAGTGFRWRALLSLACLVLIGLALREVHYVIRPPESLFSALFPPTRVGLLPTLGELWSEGERRMAIHVGLFVLVVPVLRCVAAILLALVRRTAVRLWADRLDEWSMIDVFLLALALVFDKLSELTDTSLAPAFWLLLAAGLVSELDALLVRRDREPALPAPRPDGRSVSS